MPQPPHPDLQETAPLASDPAASQASRPSRRSWLIVGLLVLLLLLAILPPLVSIGRYQRRVATSMSQVLGRPVHLDHVALNLLPFPSLTLSNLVIDELPPFGMEPIVRSSTVNARLRLLPLWRHRVEFSRITFTDPSVNLVRRSSGEWNLESVLLQAAHIDAAPTTQRRAGGQPRFPYIEATGARVNLKLDQQKTPFSLTDADFALWLPEPREWRVRLRAHPSRTDTAASDTGTVQLEATLQRAARVGDVPISLDGTWTGAPLGEASRVLFGEDAGLRGNLQLITHLDGTMGRTALSTELVLSDLHRVDLVPDRPVNVDLACRAVMTHLLHAGEDLHCSWPVQSAAGGIVRVDGAIPDLLSPASATLQLSADLVPAATVLRWIRAGTSTLPPDLHAAGQIAAQATWPGTGEPATATVRVNNLALSGASLGADPVTASPILLTATFPGAAAELSMAPATLTLDPASPSAPAPDPNPTPNPNHPPDSLVVSFGADAHGISARLAGTTDTARLFALAAALPPLGQGLRAALPQDPTSGRVTVDLAGRRPWGGPQQWTDLQTLPTSTPGAPPRHPR